MNTMTATEMSQTAGADETELTEMTWDPITRIVSCESTTPFAADVVPDVNRTNAGFRAANPGGAPRSRRTG